MEKNTRKTVLLASSIVLGFSLLLLILGPREKRTSKHGGGGSSSFSWKKPDSVQKIIIRGTFGKLDTLLVVINNTDSIFEKISYSKKIKFLLDTTRNTKKVVLIDTASGKKIRFRIKEKSWRGLYQKEFRWLERF